MNTRLLVRLASRNVRRYRRRTLITASAIAFGLAMYIYVDSFLAGADEESVRNIRWYETADAMAAVPGYMENRDFLPLDRSFDPAPITAELNRIGVPTAPRVVFSADLVFYRDPFPEDGSVPARIVAVDPDRDADVFRLEETLIKGRWIRPGEPGVLLGLYLAENIGADVGHPMIAVTQTRDGFFQTLDLEVVGILDCANPEINRDGVFIPLDAADAALEMDGRVTALHLTDTAFDGARKSRPSPAQRVVAASGLEYVDWKRQAPDYVAVMESEQAGSGLMIFLIMIIAAVGISNTMLMSVLERGREVGMMRALGMTDRQVRRLFLWESAVIGGVGSAMGLAFGALITFFFVRWGLDFSSVMKESNFGYRSAGHFYGAWHAPGFFYAVLLGVGLSVVVAWISTRRLLRLSIPAVLRYE